MTNMDSDFEHFLRHELPKLLNLSPSKTVAMELKFLRFKDYAQPLAKEMPEEFKVFFDQIKKATQEVSKFRPPRGHKTIPYRDKATGKKRYKLGKTIKLSKNT